MTVHTNLEATALILATGFLGRTPLEAALIIGSFAFISYDNWRKHLRAPAPDYA